MNDVVLHTVTRVIRRITSDPAHGIAPDESKVRVPDGFDLAGGPWKLGADNVTKLTPASAEIRDARSLPPPADVQALIDAARAIQTDTSFPAKLRALAQKIADRFDQRTPLE